MPLRQHPYVANEMQMVVRGRRPARGAVGDGAEDRADANPAVAMKFLTLDDSVSRSIAAPRLRATLVSTFASLALLLAIAGVYAVMSYTTAQRTAGIRPSRRDRRPDARHPAPRDRRGGRPRVDRHHASASCSPLITSRVVASFLFGVTHTDVDDLRGRLRRHVTAGDRRRRHPGLARGARGSAHGAQVGVALASAGKCRGRSRCNSLQ